MSQYWLCSIVSHNPAALIRLTLGSAYDKWPERYSLSEPSVKRHATQSHLWKPMSECLTQVAVMSFGDRLPPRADFERGGTGAPMCKEDYADVAEGAMKECETVKAAMVIDNIYQVVSQKQ